MNGSGCKNCPVNPCETMNYRGSACAAQRAKFGLGDPMTKADRIRAMTDEELANMVVCPHVKTNWDRCKDDCFACRLEWLQQPAEGD